MKRILIIEDHQEIAELERDFLEASDFTVDIASDGDSSLAKALADDYALVLLDIMLPGRDGFAICAKSVRKKKSPSSWSRPVVLVTASIRNRIADAIFGRNRRSFMLS